MNKAFGVMKTNVGNMVGDNSTTFATNIGVWINNRYEDVFSRYDWEELEYTQSITSTASVSAYAFNEDAGNIIFALDQTNGMYLTINTEQQFLQENYDSTDDTGTPERCFITRDVVREQPSSTTKPVLKSSSASDTTQTVTIRGISGGYETYESVTLNGTTLASATNSYSRILGISKSGVTTGYVTVYENDATTILSALPAEQLESRYKQINLHPIPTGTLVYNFRVRRNVLPLNNAYDYPVIDGIGEIIELGACADAWRYKRQFQKAREFDYLYEKKLSERIFQRTAQPGVIIQMTPTSLNRDDGIL